MFTKNPFRIVLGILFALWCLGSFAILSPLSWAIGIAWGCLSCRMFTHRMPRTMRRTYRKN
nr:MAG TPA: hypothetical protein [Caudoviricetes sp.]